MRARLVSAVFLAASVVAALVDASPTEVSPEQRLATERRLPLRCGTVPEEEADVRRRLSLMESEHAGITASTLAAALQWRIDKGVYIVQSDPSFAFRDRPFDLLNHTIVFTRSGPTGFNVQTTALNYDSNVGTLVKSTQGVDTIAQHLPFTFPFYGLSLTDATISSQRGIFFGTPPQVLGGQNSALEALTQGIPVIAPLLYSTGRAGSYGYFSIYVNSTPSALTVTWRSVSVGDQDLQVVLFSNGDIWMSYRAMKDKVGAVIVSSGTEGWYAGGAAFASMTDPSGDADGSLTTRIRTMVDIQSVSAKRVSGSDLIEIAITTAANIDFSALSAGQVLTATVERQVGSDVFFPLTVELGPSSNYYQPEVGSRSRNTTAAVVSGRTVTLRMLDDQLPASGMVRIGFGVKSPSGGSPVGDLAVFQNFVMDSRSSEAQTDFSALQAGSNIANAPLVEAFTVPTIDVFALWSALKSQYGLTDQEVDEVAFYDTFPTPNTYFYGVDGVSYNSNPQVDNVAGAGARYQYGSAYPKRASLLEMNQILELRDLTSSSTDLGVQAMRILTHEFGHRWLYFLTIREGSADTFSLTPDRSHPKQGVHLPAAFQVTGALDSSVMGGSYFTQVGPSAYRSAAPSNYPVGFSWNELYLMGLADATEITPWFYLNGAGLEGAYYPTANTVFNVTARVDVTGAQIINSLGPRIPSYATSQKTFTMAFVVVEHAGALLTTDQAVAFASNYPKKFKARFDAVTNHRGSVKTAPQSMPLEADFTFAPNTPVRGTAVSFRNNSYGETTAWQWLFGDGASSAAENPSHTFPGTGTYAVTLTVSNASFSAMTTKTVVVAEAPPTHLSASAAGPKSVTITWDAVSGSTYEVVRVNSISPWNETVVADAATSPVTDSGLQEFTTYLYKVRQKTPVLTTYAFDLATTFFFGDPILIAQSPPAASPVRVLHINELRLTLTALRRLANLGDFYYTEPTLTAGVTTVKAQHIDDLRRGIAEAYSALGLPPPTYTNSAAAGTPIRAVDVLELRARVQ